MTDISSPPAKNQIASKDRAETFAESDVTLQNSNSRVSGESVELIESNTGSQFTSGTGNTGYGNEPVCGLVVNPNKDLRGIRLNSSVAGPNRADRFVIRKPDGTRILEDTTVSLPADYLPSEVMVSGTAYDCFWEDDSRDMGAQELSNAVQSLSDFDTTDVVGIAGDILDMEGLTPVKSGTAVVEWPQPNDVYRWDAATFQVTADGETVEVYVEESVDGGSTWTEIQGPIGRGDQIRADPGSRVRFRVELSRNNIANNPTLDAIYRRWVV